ncbi:hypothetical protein AB0908_17300, partial [Enterobacter hormaechei subsp. xiangfangensis]
ALSHSFHHKELSHCEQIISLVTVGIFITIFSLRTSRENKQNGQISTNLEIYLAGDPGDCSGGSAFGM